MRRVFPVLVLSLAAAIVVALRHDWSPPTNLPPDDAARSAVSPAVVDSALAAAGESHAGSPQPAAACEDHAGWMVFPDGSEQPPLNGVTTAPKLIWHRWIPFTAVVRLERDAGGRDWYVHENGARSTTYTDARGMVMADIRMPMPVKPSADEPVLTKPNK